MNDIEELVVLRIHTFDGIIEVPFKSLELVDEFTVRYENVEELTNSLLSMLNLSVDRKRIMGVYVHYEYLRNGCIRRKDASIKYKKDNFNKNSVIDFLKDFLKKDHDMIHYCGVRKIRSIGMSEFLNGHRDIRDFEIEHAVDKYFEGAPYGIFRKVYFFLRDNGVKVNINKVIREDEATIDRNLSKFHSEDDYVGSLLRLAQNSYDYDMVYDELSKIDLEELRTSLTNPHFGLFDGVGNDKMYTLEDLYDLQRYTGMDIDDLCELVSNYRKKGTKR